MDTLTEDPFADLALARKPCGCKDKATTGDPAGSPDLNVAELEAALTAVESGEGELALVELESALDELDGLGGDGSQASLDDLVALAERHPGLKVTISF